MTASDQQGVQVLSTGTTTTGHRRIGALTGVRWWAAFGVLLAHNIPGGDTPMWVQSVFGQGTFGVTVFFVLSGFILTVTYAETLSQPSGRRVWNFYVARFARVYPLYLLVLLWVTPRKMTTIGLPLDETWLAHLFTVQSWLGLPRVYDWNGPGWSIGVEFFFYALFPIIIVLYRRLLTSVRGAAIACGIGVVALGVVASLAEPMGWAATAATTLLPPLRLPDFLLGIGIGALFLVVRDSRRVHRTGTVLVTVWLVWTIAMIALRAFYWGLPGLNILYAVPSALLILGLAWAPRLWFSRFLSTRPMIVLGEASYAFYLVHMSAGADLTIGAFHNGIGKTSMVLFILGTLFVIAMSIGLHVMIETPCRKFLRRILSRRERPRAVAPDDVDTGTTRETPRRPE